MSVPTEHDIHQAVHLLRRGEVVAFPTETVYGLGADALSDTAVARVFALKGRPSHNPLIVHVAGPEMARTVVASDLPDEQWAAAERLMRAFWPGPLSIILPKAACIPDRVTGGGDGVAVRCPDHPMTLALLRLFGSPLVGPSANRSGEVSPTAAEHVREAFDEHDVFVLDGGPCRGGIESTVVSLLADTPTILRPGLIGAEEIAGVLGRGVSDATRPHTPPRPTPPPPKTEPPRLRLVRDHDDDPPATSTPEPLPSPGMLDRHYAPHTRAILCKESLWRETLDAHHHAAETKGTGCVLISRFQRPISPPHSQIVVPMDARGYAAQLYAALRQADALGASLIVIESPPTTSSLWLAIHDRLRRATSE